MNPRAGMLTMLAAVALVSMGQALAGKEQKQVVKPPVAQAWIDVATFSGMGMPAMGMAGVNPMAMMGGLFGGGSRNQFGNTVTGSAGSWLDVTLHSRNSPNLQEAVQTVPAGSKLAPELSLVSPRSQRMPVRDDDEVVKEDFEPPKGRIYLYWGCGDTIRPGQPKVLDMSRASMEDFRKFFVSRRATQRGAHLAVGRPAWPNEQDSRMVPPGASLLGQHAFKGKGVPDNFSFNIGTAQDFMPAIELSQSDSAGATRLHWKEIPTARAYFLSAMGAKDETGSEMVFWTSSEVAEIGTGLVDYQTNPAVDRWLREKALLSPNVRTCAVPKGVFGEGAMLRMIAYGSELNLAQPPRPSDPKIPWEPDWSVKVRVKSVATAMLGMDDAMGGNAQGPSESRGRDDVYQPPGKQEEQPDGDALDPVGEGMKKLKGLFGF